MKALTHTEVVEYIKMLFPNYAIPTNFHFKDISGCDIQTLFLGYKENAESFVNAIPHTVTP